MYSESRSAGTQGSAGFPQYPPHNPDDATFLRAIRHRDAKMDGAFYYGVRTTKIFCRPSCSSRQPLVQNVIYFASVNEARQRGFRACRRCRPDLASAGSPHAELITQVCRLIVHSILGASDERPSMAYLSRLVHVSPSHLHRTFKHYLGVTPLQYAAAVRMQRFKTGVKSGGAITQALYQAGYSSSGRLYERAAKELGMTPSTYRSGAACETIRYAIVDSTLGSLLVAATERGVCAVSLGNSSAALVEGLRKEFPAATLLPDTTGLRGRIAALRKYLSGCGPHPALPLDIRGTAFQKRVWDELQRIPRGATVSYQRIAEKIGRPSAARAVAKACSGNRIALLIPCHRVVRSGGGLAGYRWGIERKKLLLQMESASTVKRK